MSSRETCKQSCSEEFTKEKFLFAVDDVKSLVKSKWPLNQWIFIGYRLSIALYAFVIFVWRTVNRPETWINLTYWAYVVITINFLVKFAAVLIYRSWLQISIDTANQNQDNANSGQVEVITRGNSQRETAPIFLKFLWLLTNISTPVSFQVTVTNWILLYDPEYGPPDHDNLQFHAGNLVLTFIDMLMIAIPYRLLHFYQPLIFAVIYFIFNGVAYAVTKETNYAFVDWTDPAEIAVVGFAVMGTLILFHCLVYGIFKVTRMCAQRITHSRNVLLKQDVPGDQEKV